MEEEKDTVAIPVEDDSKKESKKNKKDKDKKEEVYILFFLSPFHVFVLRSFFSLMIVQDELSPEDKALLEGLELAVARTRDENPAIISNALEHLRKEIRSSTTSMTSVPKPLKFLRPHYGYVIIYHKCLD